MPSAPRDPVAAFEERYWIDFEAGRVASLDAYVAAFPGDLAGVAKAYFELERLTRAGAAPRGSETLASEAAPGEAAPRAIGRYRVRRELGRGGQGVVYEAVDEVLGRRVALKVLHGLAGAPLDVVVRFKREAEIASRIDHPGICPVYDAGVADGAPYLAMRFVEGESLARRFERRRAAASGAGTPPTRDETLDLLRLVERAARALHAAHEAGVVHRDVKPGNLLVEASGAPVWVDFGLARAEAGASLTGTADVLGTPAYAAPEQLRGGAGADRRADVWSLGALLYEGVAGRRPFEAPTHERLLRAVLLDDPPPLASTAGGRRGDLATVVATALAKEPDRRYATAAAFADDVAAVLAGRAVAARRPGPVARAALWARREPWKAALLGVVVAAAGAGGPLGANYAAGEAERRAYRAVVAAREVERLNAEGAAAGLDGRTVEALRHFVAARALAPEDFEAVAGAARAALRGRRTAEARAFVAALPADAPHARVVALLRADLADLEGRADEARALRAAAPPARTSLDEFFEAARLVEKPNLGPRDGRAALAALERALALAPAPTPALASYRARFAGLAGDVPLLRFAVRVVDERYGGSFADRTAARAFALGELYEEALARLSRLTAAEPGHADHLELKGECELHLGRHADALATFERAAKIDAPSLIARRGRARALIGLKRYAEAETELRAIDDPAGRESETPSALGTCRLLQGDAAGALEFYRRAKRLDPDAAACRQNVIVALKRLRREKEALDEIRADAAAYPEDRKMRAEHARLTARVEGEAAADGVWRGLLGDFPADAALRREYAKSLLARGDKAGYAAELERAALGDPTHYDAPNERGLAALQASRFEESLAWFRRAIAADPRKTAARRNLTIAFEQLGRYEEAYAEYVELRRLLPDEARARRDLARLANRTGRFAEGRRLAEEALAADAADFEARTERGAAMAALGETDAGLAEMRAAFEDVEDRKRAMPSGVRYATALAEAGRATDAAACVAELRKEYGKIPEVRYAAARAAEAAGDAAAAAAAYVALDADYPDYLDARERAAALAPGAASRTESRSESRAVR